MHISIRQINDINVYLPQVIKIRRYLTFTNNKYTKIPLKFLAAIKLIIESSYLNIFFIIILIIS